MEGDGHLDPVKAAVLVLVGQLPDLGQELGIEAGVQQDRPDLGPRQLPVLRHQRVEDGAVFYLVRLADPPLEGLRGDDGRVVREGRHRPRYSEVRRAQIIQLEGGDVDRVSLEDLVPKKGDALPCCAAATSLKAMKAPRLSRTPRFWKSAISQI